MNPRWNILYRGPLSSCNYACGYCPFAKARMTEAELQDDSQKLERFVDWVSAQRDRQIGILFTPWGEALIHRNYQAAMLALGKLPQVCRVAIQTNLSCSLAWMEEADRSAFALWCTFHPGETSLEKFAAKIHRLHALGIRHSVGVVGLKEHLDQIARLKEALPLETYLWVNAYKRLADYYSEADVLRLKSFDPLFPLNNHRHPSLGKSCAAGSTSFTVDGDGTARRCHFVPGVLGNIHDHNFADKLSRTHLPCPNQTCGCHIGYVHMDELNLGMVFGDGILERIALSPAAAGKGGARNLLLEVSP